MDVYGQPQPEVFLVDDLFNFPNEDIFSPNSTTTSTTNSTTDSDLPLPPHHSHHPHHHQHYAHNPYSYDYTTAFSYSADFANNHTFPSTDFTDKLGVPSEDVAELEWLSNFVDDSSSEFPANYFAGTVNTSSFHSRARTKRTRPATNATWMTSSTESHSQPPNSNINRNINTGRRRESSLTRDGPSADVERRCTHCGSEKTPQWRSGPLGPKTLCNACGVRYKSGRLVPEYRPAASPTFVLTQHSNSHRKVLELRRQKEMMHHQQQQTMQMQVVTPKVEASQQQDHQMYGFRHSQVC